MQRFLREVYSNRRDEYTQRLNGFHTIGPKSTDVVKDCMLMFGCSPAEEVISRRKDRFLAKYTAMDNVIIGALLS